MPEDACAREIYERFVGYEKLTRLFGYWPGFEDAEILNLSLASQGEAGGDPSVTMRLSAFEWGHDAETGHTVINHRCIVTLRFEDVDELHLAGLTSRNPIYQLKLGEEDHMWPRRLTVHFPAAGGLSGSFCCAGAEVISVRAGGPAEDESMDA